MKWEHVLYVVAAVLVLAVIGTVLWSTFGTPPVAVEVESSYRTPEEGTLELNTATVEQLARIAGLGEHYATLIVEYRERHGAFYDLGELNGIPEMETFPVETLMPYLTVSEPF